MYIFINIHIYIYDVNVYTGAFGALAEAAPAELHAEDRWYTRIESDSSILYPILAGTVYNITPMHAEDRWYTLIETGDTPSTPIVQPALFQHHSGNLAMSLRYSGNNPVKFW